MTAAQSLFLRAHPAEAKLKWMLLVSCGVHLLVFLAIIGKPPDSSDRIYFSPVYSVSLVEMPTAGAPAAGAPAKKPTVSLKRSPSAPGYQLKALGERTHPVLTISSKEETAPAQKSAEPAAAGDAASDRDWQEAGAGGSARQPPYGGGSPGGMPNANLRFSQYYTAVWNKIRNAWILPQYGDSLKKLEAIVIIRISGNGTIASYEFEKRSGNEGLDRSVERAIRKADARQLFLRWCKCAQAPRRF